MFVSISQVIGCEDCLQNDLHCVGSSVELYFNCNPALCLGTNICKMGVCKATKISLIDEKKLSVKRQSETMINRKTCRQATKSLNTILNITHKTLHYRQPKQAHHVTHYTTHNHQVSTNLQRARQVRTCDLHDCHITKHYITLHECTSQRYAVWLPHCNNDECVVLDAAIQQCDAQYVTN